VARVSLEKQAAEGYSLDNQKQVFEELGGKYGCQFPPQFVIEDDGYSGADFDRPSIKRILNWAREGKIQAVCFTYVDRLARDVEGGLRLIREFTEAGLKVLLGNLGWVTDEGHAKILLTMYLVIAEVQRKEIRERSKTNVRTKIGMGQPHGGHAPFGLHFVTKAELAARAITRGEQPPRRPGNEYRRVEKDLQFVRRIYELIDADHSLREIGRIFEAEGKTTPRGCQRCRGAGAAETCTHWNTEFFSKIASDEFYATGVWFYNKRKMVEPKRIRSNKPRHRRKSSWRMRPRSEWLECYKTKPVVDRTLFDRVQQKLAKNKSRLGGQPSDRYLLTSLLKCRVCGKAWWERPAGKANPGTPARTGIASTARAFAGSGGCDAKSWSGYRSTCSPKRSETNCS
jgi:site-specific DNA recombinase